MIADWVWYVCPVPAAKPIVAKELHDPDVARSPLVFPGAGLIGDAVPSGTSGGEQLLGSRVRNYYVYSSDDDYREWSDTFEPIVYA
jgi:spermidine/putrescine transport system substrate-binding protein